MVLLQNLAEGSNPSKLIIDRAADTIISCFPEQKVCAIHDSQGNLQWKSAENDIHTPSAVCAYQQPSNQDGERYLIIYDDQESILNVINIVSLEIVNKFEVHLAEPVIDISSDPRRDWLYILTCEDQFTGEQEADQVSRIYVFTIDGIYIRSFGRNGNSKGEFSNPVCVDVCPVTSNVIVLNQGNGTVQLFDANGESLREIGNYGSHVGEFVDPSDAVFDHLGNLIVSDAGNMRIQCFDSSLYGRVNWIITKPELSETPSRLAVDSDGDILVSFTKPGLEIDWFTCPVGEKLANASNKMQVEQHPGCWENSPRNHKVFKSPQWGEETKFELPQCGEETKFESPQCGEETKFESPQCGEESIFESRYEFDNTNIGDESLPAQHPSKSLIQLESNRIEQTLAKQDITVPKTSRKHSAKKIQQRKLLKQVDVRKHQEELRVLVSTAQRMQQQMVQLKSKLTKHNETSVEIPRELSSTSANHSDAVTVPQGPLNKYLQISPDSTSIRATVLEIDSQEKLEELKLDYELLTRDLSKSSLLSWNTKCSSMKGEVEKNKVTLEQKRNRLRLLPARDTLTLEEAGRRRDAAKQKLSDFTKKLERVCNENEIERENLMQQVESIKQNLIRKSEEVENLKVEMENVTKHRLGREVRVEQLLKQKNSLEEQLAEFGVDEPYLRTMFVKYCNGDKDFIPVSDAFSVLKGVFEHKREGKQFDLTPAQVSAYFALREGDPMFAGTASNDTVTFNEILVAYASLS